MEKQPVSSALTVKLIKNPDIRAVWPKIRKYIENAQPWGYGDHTIEQIELELLVKDDWILLVAEDENKELHGAATFTFINYPNDRVAFMTYIGGHLVSNPDTNSQLERILRLHGATKIQGFVRKSMARYARLFGYRERGIVVETKL
jgi:hypothetical protein